MQFTYELLTLDGDGTVEPPRAAAAVKEVQNAGGMSFSDATCTWLSADGTSLYACLYCLDSDRS